MRRALAVSLSILSMSFAAMPPAAPQDGDPIVYSTYRFGGRRAGAAIFTIVPGGQRVPLTGSRSFNLEPMWSPDRTRVVYVHYARPRNPDVWVMNADGSGKVRLTRRFTDDVHPRWSPDGTEIAWVKAPRGTGAGRIYVMQADGSGKVALTPEGTEAAMPAWSPDGSRIAYVTFPRCNDCDADAEIHVVDRVSGQDTVLTDNDVEDAWPVWAPDGSLIVFGRESVEGGDLFTMAPDGSNQQQLTSLDGSAFLPAWSPDGSEVAFTLAEGGEDFNTRLGVVVVATGEERLLTGFEAGGVFPDWSPDGSRIAFLGFNSGGHEIGMVPRDGGEPSRVTRSKTDEGWLDW